MNQTIKHIQDVKLAHVDWLLSLDDVHTVAIGYKIINGIPTERLSITIFTTDKKPLQEIPSDQIIPPFLHEVPTDVIESPEFVLYQHPANANQEKYRPAPGGVEIFMPSSPYTGSVCTLGMYAHSLREGDPYDDVYLLANAHCFYRPDQVIFQPASIASDNRIAYATRTVNSEYVDGGIAYMLNSEEAETNLILGIGKPRGIFNVNEADLGETVIKSGRTTGVTTGTLAYLHADADDKKDQIIVVNQNDVTFSDHGDSGSVVLLKEGEYQNHVIGLLWGGALMYTILSPIQYVIDELEIELIFDQES